MKPIIIEKHPLTLAAFKHELASVKKRDTELTFRGQKAEEYVQQVSTISHTKAEELFKELKKLEIPRLKDEHIAKLIDIMPHTAADVKLVLSGYAVTVNDANIKRIVEAITPYAQ